MDMGMGWKIAIAAMMLFFIIRIWPTAKHWMTDGPKGSSNDWMTAAMLLGAVILFVLILMKLV